MDEFRNFKKGNKEYKRRQIISTCGVIIVTSFLGFIIENSFLALKFGYVDNRGMVFPFLFGYGVAIVAISLLFGLPDDPLFFGHPTHYNKNKHLKYILTIMIVVCIGESSLGMLVEKLTGVQWWNYNEIPLHIGQYTSIPTSIGFALIIYIFMKNAYTPICQYAVKMDAQHHANIIAVLMLIIIVDYLFSTAFMAKHGETIPLWHKAVPQIDIENLKDLKEALGHIA